MQARTGTVVLRELTEQDFDTLAVLGRTIWLSHYAKIVSVAQIEYMLAGRYAAENLRRYLGAADRWLDLLVVDDVAVGYCSVALAPVSGEMKLEQLYLLPDLHGRGLGRRMLDHVEARCRAASCDHLVLQVNKRNTDSIAIYRKCGFVVREEAVFDIGNGYLMDDYIMVKALAKQ